MHPETLRQYQLLRENLMAAPSVANLLTTPHHFHVRRNFSRAAEDLAYHEITSDRFFFPEMSRLPCPLMVLTADYESGPLVFVLAKDSEDRAAVAVYAAADGDFLQLGKYRPGSSYAYREVSSETTVEQKAKAAMQMLAIAMIVSLINEPRIVEASPASGLDWSRQHRKAVERVTGKAAMAFSVVSWKIGKHAKAIGNRLSEEGHPKALHWCRAHWRRAEEGQPKAEWVNIPRKGGWGWYCWAADCWKGHPDFGIKLQRHEPHFEGEPRSRYIGGDRVLDSTRFAAMGAAQRAALVEAGFAPSLTVH